MKILQRYILLEHLRYVALSVGAFTALFLIFDFFDRIDTILTEGADLLTILAYFLYKIPPMISLCMPIGMLVATMLALGLLSKNSEITAMRASGLTIAWLTRPIFIVGLILSILTCLNDELLVPYCQRRVNEIFNIDIREKHTTGKYSQGDLWWRKGSDFISVGVFDSRNNTLYDLTKFEVNSDFEVEKRTTADHATFAAPGLGWTLHNVNQYRFSKKPGAPVGLTKETPPDLNRFDTLAFPISEKPEDFYNTKTDPFSMSYRQLANFIQNQVQAGIPAQGLYTDLYAKISFPLLIFICALVAIPFAIRPARSGGMALSFIAGITIGFSYYAVHSFSLAMGRAEIWPPMLAAWMGNLLMGLVGFILLLGAEAPED